MTEQLQNQKKQKSNQTIWNAYSIKDDDTSLPRYTILTACFDNKVDIIKQFITESEWTPFELMIRVISGCGHYYNLATWDYLIPLLTKEDATKTFTSPTCGEHTLLTYCCYYSSSMDKMLKEKITYLIQLGCQWEQIVQTNKTALSFLVVSDRNIELVQWCITQGANPHHGHLLCHVSNWRTEKQYNELLFTFEDKDEFKQLDDKKINPYSNNAMFDYVLELGLDVHDVLENGMTPLIAACCEGSEYKITLLLSLGVTIYHHTLDGADVWLWAKRHVRYQCYEYEDIIEEYPLEDILRQWEKQYWTEILENLYQDIFLLQDIPRREMIQVLVQLQ